MKRVSLTNYEEFPEAMLTYLRHYGPHFSRKLCDFAVSKMYKKSGEEEVFIEPLSKEQVANILRVHNVKLKKDQLYDSTYVANMCIADFYESSVPDERHMALYIKDVIDDVDAEEGIVFNRWYADMCYCGIAVDWESML